MERFAKITVLFLLLCAVTTSTFSQRILSKTLVNRPTRHFYIDAQHAFQVGLNTNTNHEISVKALAEGEYEKDLILDLREEGSHIHIGISFHPDYHIKNDKLSAHKVISVSLEISIPAEMFVYLNGVSSRIEIEGLYKLLQVVMQDGHCDLDQVNGVVKVSTTSGGISLKSNGGVVSADTEFGQLEIQELPLGEAEYSLKSISGDIHVQHVLR